MKIYYVGNDIFEVSQIEDVRPLVAHQLYGREMKFDASARRVRVSNVVSVHNEDFQR